jgi:hypothetical protein
MNAFWYLKYFQEKNKNEELELKNLTMNNDLADKYEFKIVSYFGVFQSLENPEVFNKITSEESNNGWEFVSKSPGKISFRRVKGFNSNSSSDINPYRTVVNENNLVLKYIAIILLITALILLPGLLIAFF